MTYPLLPMKILREKKGGKEGRKEGEASAHVRTRKRREFWRETEANARSNEREACQQRSLVVRSFLRCVLSSLLCPGGVWGGMDVWDFLFFVTHLSFCWPKKGKVNPPKFTSTKLSSAMSTCVAAEKSSRAAHPV